MGVDYDANYGIGFEVDVDEEVLEVAECETVAEYLHEKIGWTRKTNELDFRYFETGEGNYTGEDNDCFVVINKPLKEIAKNIDEEEKALREFLQTHGITVESEFDLVGGLHVW